MEFKNTCKDCAWWIEVETFAHPPNFPNEKMGQCRRWPPFGGMSTSTEESYWCGEYASKFVRVWAGGEPFEE